MRAGQAQVPGRDLKEGVVEPCSPPAPRPLRSTEKSISGTELWTPPALVRALPDAPWIGYTVRPEEKLCQSQLGLTSPALCCLLCPCLCSPEEERSKGDRA